MNPTNPNERRAAALERVLETELRKMDSEDVLEAAQKKGVFKCEQCKRKRGWKSVKVGELPVYLACLCSTYDATHSISCQIVNR